MYPQLLMNELSRFNTEYRSGIPSISDARYDELLDKLEGMISPSEFLSFKKTLTEENGEIKFNYVVGSLKKFKYEEAEEFHKWLNKEKIQHLFCSEKIDGCSYVAVYNRGKLVSVSSRGDGENGTDWTDKAMYIDSLPKEIQYPIDASKEIHIRGEFTLTGDDYKVLNGKNRRTSTVGLMNKKEISEHINLIKAYVYEVITEDWDIVQQFSFLNNQRFLTPVVAVFHRMDNVHENIKEFYLNRKELSVYDIDGIVVSDRLYTPERNEFFPNKKIAFKINTNGVESEIIGIEWNISKERKIKPTILISPIQISGSTVSRVTGNNCQWLKDRGLGIGAKITVQKRGEVIPGIDEILETAELHLPEYCPECSSSIEWNGVDLQCTNEECGSVKRVESFIRNSEIENVSATSLSNWGIESFDDLLSWQPDTKYKSQVKFYNELLEKIFHQTPEHIIRNMSCTSLGQTLFDLLYNHQHCDIYAMNNIFNNGISDHNLPVGIGIKTIINATESWKSNWEILHDIISDPRYKEPEVKIETKKEIKMNDFFGKSFLMTGKFSETRGKLEDRIQDLGGNIASSVTKTLDTLFCASDSWGNSSKFNKAQKLGVNIKTEEEFWKMLNEAESDK